MVPSKTGIAKADGDNKAIIKTKKSGKESIRTPERNGDESKASATKRQKSLTDTPTIPVVTNPLSQYDAVLTEAQDFIQAASEAQNLGRLSISASYLALSHSRLMGLAKRFDLAAPSAAKNQAPVLDDQLKALLPADVEWDQAMMAHLASAAAEYHAARTTDGKANNSTTTTTAPSATTPRQFSTSTSITHPEPAVNNCNVRSVLGGRSLFDQEEKKASADKAAATPPDDSDPKVKTEE